MSKRDSEQDNGDTTETRRVKLAIGGAVLELLRKWGVFGLIGWVAFHQLPVPGISPKKAEALPRTEFEQVWAEHEKWGTAVKSSIEQRLTNIEGGVNGIAVRMERMEQRLERVLDKRLAAVPTAITNVIAGRP